MFTIYIHSFDLRRIVKTIKEQKASHNGLLFRAISGFKKIENMEYIAGLNCVNEHGNIFCEIIIDGESEIEKTGEYSVTSTISLASVDVPLKDLEFLLNNKYGEEVDNTKLTVKVGDYNVTIEKNDVVEYEEPCPHCGATVLGVTDSSLVATCPECGKELMVCSFCPTFCEVKDKKDCKSCIFCGMDCTFECNGNTGEGCHMKLRAKNIKTF